MRIAFITQWYDPEVGSAAIPGAVVRALQARGHDVEVITGFPNYPTGRLYDGYRLRPYLRDEVRGVVVHRLPLYPSHDASAVRRILNFLSFMVSSTLLAPVLARRCQVALVYSTPATVGMAGIALRALLRRPFVLYVQDLWPDTLTATGMLPARLTRPAEWVLHRFCNRVYRSAAHIAVISPGMKTILMGRGVPESKIDVVYNWVDEQLFRPVAGTSSAEGPFEVMYAGAIGPVQGLDVAVRALALLRPDEDVRLRLIGSGGEVPALQRLADELGVADRVTFEGPRSVGEMSEVMASAHVQLVCLKDDPLFHFTMPSKIQAILASGRPVITCAPGDVAALTAASGAGWAVGPGDAAGLAEAFRAARSLTPHELDELGRAGHTYYQDRLSARFGAEQLEGALTSALGETKEAGTRAS
ncbi:glycosyltransferase family 4 protein [Nocardioides sp. KIGAM211]|uniref:Glycosyltransferase family 4 protein n=1 Tax=Nocardioides luti TaxID=2761101 RepID=A0A7X0RHM4_9ACTN|nr:glycosyltransferase family 4 protein [Nocardioides luti]